MHENLFLLFCLPYLCTFGMHSEHSEHSGTTLAAGNEDIAVFLELVPSSYRVDSEYYQISGLADCNRLGA